MKSFIKQLAMFFFIVALGSEVQAQIIGNTAPGRLLPVKLSIQITEPAISNGEWATKLKAVSIKGILTGNVERVTINAKDAILLKNNTFIGDVQLTKGRQYFKVTAYDKRGNIEEAEFTIICNADDQGPVLALLEPIELPGKQIVISEGITAIRGEATDESGVEEVVINGVKASFISQKEFFGNVKLSEGPNVISIHAVDKSGNATEKLITVYRSSDTKGPYITVLEPAVTRGLKVVSKKELITVRGFASDESGVESVFINDRKAILNPSGEFTLDISLNAGDNKIVVQSSDKKNNISVDSFYVTRTMEDMLSPGKYYALIIGINAYKGELPALRNAVNDAKAVEQTLKENYVFDEIFKLYYIDATRGKIIDMFEMMVNKVTKNDNLIIFYSGHGDFRQQLNKGYWVPVDATTKSTSGYISNSDIQTFIGGIPAKHTLLVSDACFSGDIFRGVTSQIPFEDSERYYKEVYRRTSRCALTSGGIEPVADGGREGHSVFTYYLLDKLKSNQTKYFTAGQLFQDIQIPVTNNSEQSPIFQPIKNSGDEGGQFIFIKK